MILGREVRENSCEVCHGGICDGVVARGGEGS